MRGARRAEHRGAQSASIPDLFGQYPGQLALADSLRAEPEHWRQLPAFYRAKRDRFVQALASSRLEILPCAGTYFLLADYSAISDLDDVAFCHWLTEHVGVAAIPLSVFCADPFPIN